MHSVRVNHLSPNLSLTKTIDIIKEEEEDTNHVYIATTCRRCNGVCNWNEDNELMLLSFMCSSIDLANSRCTVTTARTRKRFVIVFFLFPTNFKSSLPLSLTPSGMPTVVSSFESIRRLLIILAWTKVWEKKKEGRKRGRKAERKDDMMKDETTGYARAVVNYCTTTIAVQG